MASDAEDGDLDMHDASAAGLKHHNGSFTGQELDEKFPNRPHNHHATLPFHALPQQLFNPLNNNKKKPAGPVARGKVGPHGPDSLAPHEVRRNIIEGFFSRWRREVGDDVYPALRLIVPEKDRDRAMYGLKEKAIGKLLVKTMKIDKNSEDGFNLLNWKLPGQTTASRMAGDFAGRCFEVLSKRPIRTAYGDMKIDEVNDLLDRLAFANREEHQLPIFDEFYRRMNPEELMWLVRIVLRQMKVGATERTFFDIWHADAESLFNVSSSLRRVCWELHDPSLRLDGDERDLDLMQCFQPQLAQFQMHSFEKMVERLRPTEEDPTFWIEEKLDGERMQLHLTADDSVPGGKRFGFWSRKAKDYTYLYGEGFEDDNAALTRHIRAGFDGDVQNLILDGEMITWDPEQDAIVPFGTLKTAALAESRHPFGTGQRPLFRVFDLLYLNGECLTHYTLRDRRRALEACIKPIHRRLEIHAYQEARNAAEIEPVLRKVVAEASEGLVLKNPRSMYRLNERNDDWIKVKPEYMTEFGESLDCVVIGGYYGSGKRGGKLSSFLCGLRVDRTLIEQGANPMKCYSFFKVGGGFTATDYASVRHHTDGKWKDWDRKNPPTDFVELAGGDAQIERPDVWIRPDESVVVSVKAAQVTTSDSFRMGLTLRFPRFKRLRMDRDWTSALSVQDFLDLKSDVEKERDFAVDDGRRKRVKTTRRRSLVVAGTDPSARPAIEADMTRTFADLTFYIITDSLAPVKSGKSELDRLVKANGGKIVQTYTAASDTICVADRRTVRVAALQKAAQRDIIRPVWIFDCIDQARLDEEKGRQRLLLPLEPRHLFSATAVSEEAVNSRVDGYGDSYARDVTVDELRGIVEGMPKKYGHPFSVEGFRRQLAEHGTDLSGCLGWLLEGLTVYVDLHDLAETNGLESDTALGDAANEATETKLKMAGYTLRFAGASVVEDLSDEQLTHVVAGKDAQRLKAIRARLSSRKKLPRIVTVAWVEQSWTEGTLIDEERFAP